MATRIGADETGLDTLDLSKEGLRDAANLRRIIVAREAIERAERELRDAVAGARSDGDSWALIGLALETTRQAAYQRFGKP